MTPTSFAIVIPTTASDPEALRRAVRSAILVGAPILIVAQGDLPRVRAALEGLEGEVRVIADDGRGASRARNIGLESIDREWVLFLDDDAEILDGFRDVLGALAADQALRSCAAISWRVVDEHGADISRYPDESRPLTVWNHWHLVREHSVLWRVSDLRAVGGFDEALGPGTWAGSDEGADLMIRLLARRRAGRYLPIRASRHPGAEDYDSEKARRYARGTGRLLRTHVGLPASWPYAVRSVAGTASIILPSRFHRYPRRLKLYRAKGIAEGFIWPDGRGREGAGRTRS